MQAPRSQCFSPQMNSAPMAIEKIKILEQVWSYSYPEFEGLTVHLYLLHSCKTDMFPALDEPKSDLFFFFFACRPHGQAKDALSFAKQAAESESVPF